MGKVIAVIGASGGLGATSLACALAVRAGAAGWSACILDADPWGAGLDVQFGLEQEAGLRWSDVAPRICGQVDGAALAAHLPGSDSVRVLSHARSALQLSATWPREGLLESVVGGLSAVHDLVVIDCARDQAVLPACVAVATEVVIVCGGRVGELSAGSVLSETVVALGTRPVLVGRDTTGSTDGIEILAAHVAISLAATLRFDRGLAREEVDGVAPGVRGRGPVVDAADAVLLHCRVGRALESRSARHSERGGRSERGERGGPGDSLVGERGSRRWGRSA